MFVYSLSHWEMNFCWNISHVFIPEFLSMRIPTVTELTNWNIIQVHFYLIHNLLNDAEMRKPSTPQRKRFSFPGTTRNRTPEPKTDFGFNKTKLHFYRLKALFLLKDLIINQSRKKGKIILKRGTWTRILFLSWIICSKSWEFL